MYLAQLLGRSALEASSPTLASNEFKYVEQDCCSVQPVNAPQPFHPLCLPPDMIQTFVPVCKTV